MSEDLAISRRHVLKWTGAGAAAVAVSGVWLPNFGISEALAADLGSGDVGVLNYAYALEQLEAAFYTRVIKTPYAGMNANAHAILRGIRNHEIAHRNFLKKHLGRHAIPNLKVDFSKVDFSSMKSVLGTADVFENLGVGAYNGAGQLLRHRAYLEAAGSIVSVEARHAAAIADLIHPLSASAVGRGNVHGGLDEALAPGAVLPKALPFITSHVTARSLT